MGPEDNPADDVEPTEAEWAEWERAYDEAPAVPISDDRIAEIVEYATTTCPRCEGIGSVRWPSEDGGSPELVCPDCGGTGKIKPGT